MFHTDKTHHGLLETEMSGRIAYFEIADTVLWFIFDNNEINCSDITKAEDSECSSLTHCSLQTEQQVPFPFEGTSF